MGTRGRENAVHLVLNIELFDDFLCIEARIVAEVDGEQHLSDANAYRRDRRKDRLLQENGYIVLRFLAEDLAKDLDSVLDAILRALTRHQKSS
jgi:very-short-patch-repair endonuclease